MGTVVSLGRSPLVGPATIARAGRAVRVTALAGGVGAGKFLRGLARAVPPDDLTVVVNTGDDLRVHALHVSPDVDSVTYWLAGVADRERGWGRAGDTFHATDELRRLAADGTWFGLGDLDLATHLLRTAILRSGRTLTQATEEVTRRFGVPVRVLPMTDDEVTTRIDAVDEEGRALDLHFQEYWVRRGARDEVKGVRYAGAEAASPAPGVVDAIVEADVVLFCPSNPVASIGPILALESIRAAVAERRDNAVGVSPIVGGAPLRGMADRLLRALGIEVSAAGVAAHFGDVLGGWVVDEVDRRQAERVEGMGLRAAVTDTIMVDDEAAEAVARTALLVGLEG